MPTFDIKNKVALITGGAQGLGLEYAKKLLEEGARGVTLADVNETAGEAAVVDIEQKYGKGKSIFVVCDVTNKQQYEDAFKKTVETFKNIDILINNAGIFHDKLWEKEIAVNVNGVIHGMLLALDNFIPKYKSGSEGLIVNISSIAGIHAYDVIPIYCGSKFAVHGMTISWGTPNHYERTKVRVVGVCPGVTDTDLLRNCVGLTLGEPYEAMRLKSLPDLIIQTPEQMADGMMTIIKKAPNGTMWVVEGGSKPFLFKIPDYTTMEKEYLE